MIISLSKEEQSVLRNSLNELSGAFGVELEKIIAMNEAESIAWSDKLSNIFNYKSEEFDLDREEWVKLYNLSNAVLYVLGAEELSTLTGKKLHEYANTNRKLFANIYLERAPDEEYLNKYRWISSKASTEK